MLLQWYLCLALSIILLACALRVAVGKRYGKLKIGLVLILLVVATYILYVPIFFGLYNAATAVIEGIINVMQVVSLDADFISCYDMINREIGIGFIAKIYLTLMGWIHFLLPTVSVFAAYTILIRCFSSLRLLFMNARKSPLFVFSEYNDASANLASDIIANYKRCDLIFAGCDDSIFNKRAASLAKAVFINDSVEELKISHKKSRNVFFFCISENEDKNMNDAVFLAGKCISLEKDIQKNIHILLFSTQNEASIMLDSVEKGSLDIRQVDICEATAYRLLDSYPLLNNRINGKSKTISVLLFGFTDINESLLRAAIWCGQVEGCHLRINVAGINISDKIDEFRLLCPSLMSGKYDINFYSRANYKQLFDAVRENCPDATYISVDCGDDGKTVEYSLALRRMFYCIDNEFSNKPPIFAYIRNENKYSMVRGLTTSEQNVKKRVPYDIIPYGSMEETFTCKNLVDSDIDFLTRGVHLVYEDIFSDTEINVQEALERFNVLEVNKRSSRANAMHIRYKLRALGLDYTDGPGEDEVNLADYLTDEKLEMLTRAEHYRWEAFLEYEGWVTATVEQSDKYKSTGLSAGRHNCPLLEMHPYICPFDELPERSEALGLPDSTVHDRELIRRIPDILHDRWNISDKEFRIIKI